MLVVEVQGLRFHLGHWGMSLHLATDRIHEQFAYRSQGRQAWIGQPDRDPSALTWRIVGRNPGRKTIRQMVDEPGIRCRTGFGDRRNDMRCHTPSPAQKVVEVYPLAAPWLTRFLQSLSPPRCERPVVFF